MPRVAVVFAESALRDLEEIRTWYLEQGVPETGDRLVAEIFQQVERLVDHPEVGRIVPEFGQAFLRELIHPPFRVVYRRDPERVRVVRVWRSERLLRLSLDPREKGRNR
jgi:toxin ParE1/3/4